LQAEMDKRLEVRADQLAQLLQPNGDTTGRVAAQIGTIDLSAISSLDEPLLFAQVRDLHGTLLATSVSLRGDALPLGETEIQEVLVGRPVIRDAQSRDQPLRSLATVLMR